MVYHRQYYNREYETRAEVSDIRRHSPAHDPQSRRLRRMPSSPNSLAFLYRNDYSRSQHCQEEHIAVNNLRDRHQQAREQHQHQHEDQHNCSINQTNLSYKIAVQRTKSTNDRNSTSANLHVYAHVTKAMSDINYRYGQESSFDDANGDGGSLLTCTNSVIGLNNINDSVSSCYGSTSSSLSSSSPQRRSHSHCNSQSQSRNRNPNENQNTSRDHSAVGMKNKESIHSNSNISLYRSRFQHSPTRRLVDNSESENKNEVAIGVNGGAGRGGDQSALDGFNINGSNNDDNNDNMLPEKNQVGSVDRHVRDRGACLGRNVQQFQQLVQDNNFKRIIGTSSTSTNTKGSQEYRVQYSEWKNDLSLGKNNHSNIRNDHHRPHEILEATNNDDDDDNNKNSENYNYNSNNQESSSDPSTAAASNNSRRAVQNHFPSSILRSRSRSRSRSRGRLTAHDNITNGKTISKNTYGKKQNRNESIIREAPPSQQSNKNRITNRNKHNLDERNGNEEVYRSNMTRNFGTRKQLHRPYPVGLNTPTTSKEEAIIDNTEQKNLEDDDHSNEKSNHSSSRNSNGNHSDASRAVTDSAENKSVLEKAHFWRHQLSNQRSRSSTASSSAMRRISTPSRVDKNTEPAVETPVPSEQQEEPQSRSEPQNLDNNSKNPNQGRMKEGHLPTPSTKTPIPLTKEASSEQKQRNEHAKSSLPTYASSKVFFNPHPQYIQQKSRTQHEDTEALQTRSKAHEEATSPQKSLSDRVSENRQNLRSSLVQNTKSDGLKNKDAPEAANAMQPSARTFGHNRQLKSSKASYGREESKQSQTSNRGKNVPVIPLTSGSHKDDQKLKAKECEIRQNDSYDTSSSQSQRNKSFGSSEPTMHSFARAKSRVEKMGKKSTPVLTEDEQKSLRNKTQSDHRAEIIASTSTSTNRHVLQRGKDVSHPTSENYPVQITQAVTINNRNVSSLRNDETPSANLLSPRSSQEEKNYVHMRTRTNSQTKHQTSLAEVKKPAIIPPRSTSRGKINEGLQNNQNDATTQSDAKEDNQKSKTTKINMSKISPQRSVTDQGSDKIPQFRNRRDMMQSLQSMRNNTKSLSDIDETPTATPPRQSINNSIEGKSKSPMPVSPSCKSLHERICEFNTGCEAPTPPQCKTEKAQYRELNVELQESDSEPKENLPTKKEQGSLKEGGGIQQVSTISESQETFDSVKSDSQQESSENSTIDSLSLSVSEAKKRLWDDNERLRTCHRGRKRTMDTSADTTIDTTIDSSDSDTTMFKSKFVRAAEVSQSGMVSKTHSTESQQSSYQYSGKSFGRSENSAQNSDKIKKSVEERKKQHNSKERKYSTSVAKLVAKLTSVKRDDPSAALRMIDSILRSESRDLGMIEEDKQASEQEKDKCSKAFQDPQQHLKSNNYVNKQPQEERMREKDGYVSCDSDPEESIVSAITDPTYQSGFGEMSSIISRHGKKRPFRFQIPRDGGPSLLHRSYSSSRAPRNRNSIPHSSTKIQQGVTQESSDLNNSRESDWHDTSTFSERIKKMSASQSLSPSDRINRLAQTVVGNCEDVVHDPQAKCCPCTHIQDMNTFGEEALQEDNHFEQQYISPASGIKHELPKAAHAFYYAPSMNHHLLSMIDCVGCIGSSMLEDGWISHACFSHCSTGKGIKNGGYFLS